ncbi:MAG: GGDEF domain-containing protein [Campylobacterota bacterium]|nr:GGDEF domain-containing protein [Campylobacterota bacterium]
MTVCEELNFLLIVGLIFSVYMYIMQKNKLKKLNYTEADLIKKAYFDSLTGLPNKENINIILDDQIHRCKRHNKSFYIAIVKIDNLNDAVIAESGSILSDTIRNEDIIGHISKGVFVVVFNEYLEEANSYIIFDRIHEAFKEEVTVDNYSYKVSANIVINMYPEKSTFDELIS